MAQFDPTLNNPEALAARLVESGAFDRLREEALQQLREHQGLRKHVVEQAQNALPELVRKGVDGKRKLFEELRRRLESDVLIKAMESYWEVLSCPDHSWSSLLDAEVESCLCQWAEERSATTTTGHQ